MAISFGKYTKELAALMLAGRPAATAMIMGSNDYPEISGKVWLYGLTGATLVVSEIYGLPVATEVCDRPIFGFHIHDGAACTPRGGNNPFSDAKNHFNPAGCMHPHHAGDLPPLFGNSNGGAWSAVVTDSFLPFEVVGKSVVIHLSPDDFSADPSGNSGTRIACGEIVGAGGGVTPRIVKPNNNTGRI